MNWLGIEYRDPLFGIIILFLTIFLVSFLAYSLNKKKEQNAKEAHQDLLKRFELGSLEINEYIKLYTASQLPLDSILLLSTTFIQKGDYNKAINLYLGLLEHTNERIKKEEIMEYLGKAYFKTGLLQRSKEIFLQILKFSPRNKNALLFLLLTHEKLQDYKKAMQTLEPLIELGYDAFMDKVYLQAQMICNDSILSDEAKLEKMTALYQQNHAIERFFMMFLLRTQNDYFWKNAHLFTLSNIIDILWYIPKDKINFDAIIYNDFLQELYSAKKFLHSKNTSEVFELDLLLLHNTRSSPKTNIDLNFEYTCQHCKTTHFVYSHRCANCNKLFSLQSNPKLAKLNFETNNSLQ